VLQKPLQKKTKKTSLKLLGKENNSISFPYKIDKPAILNTIHITKSLKICVIAVHS